MIIRRNDLFRPKSKKSQNDKEKFNINKQSSTEKRSVRSVRSEKSEQSEQIGRSEKPGKSEQSEQSEQTFVDNRSKTNNNLQTNEIIIKDKSVGTKVYAKVEKIDETAMVVYDKVVVSPVLKIMLKYKNVTRECKATVAEYEGYLIVIGCNNEIHEIAEITRRRPPKADILNAINEYVDAHFDIESTPLVDYVRQKYADGLAEIERDPFAWILSHTKEIVGYDRLKLLTLLSVISSRMKRVMGISRIHINIVGQSGAGKSSVVKSVLKFVDDRMKVDATRFTEKALGYLVIDTFDGKVVFLEQIDNQNVAYLREALSEEKICTYVTEKDASEGGGEKLVTSKKCIDGQPAFITTSVSDRVDLDREQIANRMLNVYLKYTYSRDIAKSILERAESEVSEVDKMVFMAYLLSRPNVADITPVEDRIIAFVDKLAELTRSPVNRTVEIIRNLVRAVAIARGKTKVSDEDYNFVMQNFQLDILYNGLGLTERDIEIIEALPDEGGLKSQEVADRLRVPKQYAINVLRNLERKGVVDATKEDGKTFTWYLTALGRRIKALVGNINVVDEKGELIGEVDGKFCPNSNSGDDRENTVSGNDGGGMSRGDEKDDRDVEAYLGLLLEYISSKFLGKKEVTEEELRGILERTTQVTDPELQNVLIEALEEKGIIRKSDGTWKVLDDGPDLLELYKRYSGKVRSRKDLVDELGLRAYELLNFCEKRNVCHWIDGEHVRFD